MAFPAEQERYTFTDVLAWDECEADVKKFQKALDKRYQMGYNKPVLLARTISSAGRASA